MGIPKKYLTKENRDKAWKMYTDGYYIWEIAKELNLTEAIVVVLLNLRD